MNAWILFNKYFVVGNKWPILKFRESIVLSLLTTRPIEIVKPGRRPLVTNVHSNSRTHWMKEAEGSKRKARKRCVGCYEQISLNEGSKNASESA